MVSLQEILTIVQISIAVVTAILSFFHVEGPTSHRDRVLNALNRVNPDFDEFTEIAWLPANSIVSRESRYTILWGIVQVLPLLGIAFLSIYTLNRFTSIYSPSIFTWLFFTAFAYLVVEYGLYFYLEDRAENLDMRNPSKSWMFLYFIFRSLSLYLALTLVVFLLLLAAQLLTLYQINSGFAVNFVSSEFFVGSAIVAIVISAGILFLFFTLRRREIPRIENTLFSEFFGLRLPFVELVVHSRGEPQEIRVGYLTDISGSALLRRLDGFTENIEWKDIRRVAAGHNFTLAS